MPLLVAVQPLISKNHSGTPHESKMATLCGGSRNDTQNTHHTVAETRFPQNVWALWREHDFGRRNHKSQPNSCRSAVGARFQEADTCGIAVGRQSLPQHQHGTVAAAQNPIFAKSPNLFRTA